MDIHSEDNSGDTQSGSATIGSEATQSKQCLVCGDVSSGNHYGATTCEGCKGFFRRIICYNNQNSYQCVNNANPDQCPITSDITRRKCCKSCRYRKCLEIGMRADLCVKTEPKDKRLKPSQLFGKLFDSEEERIEIKKNIIDAFQKQITFQPFDDILSAVTQWVSDKFIVKLNQMMIHLSAKVRAFVSNIGLFRRFDYRIQNQLINASMTETLAFMLVVDFQRNQNFLTNNGFLFGDSQVDNRFRTLIEITNQLMAISAPDHQILSLIPAITLLIILNCYRIEANDENELIMTKEQIFLAFDLTDPMLVCNLTQILHYLRSIGSSLKGKLFI